MTVADIMWLVGTGVGVALTVAGMVIAAFQKLSSQVADERAKRSEQTAALHAKMDGVKDELNGRIERVKDDYVRSDHLEVHLKGIRDLIATIAERIGHMSIKIDQLSEK